MKRVLVISDNPNLAGVLARLIDGQSLCAIADFQYRFSSMNHSPEAMQKLGYSAINIKAPDSVEWVINSFDLILSIHCKQIFPAEVVNNVTCVNVHPGMNPYNRGWYPQVFSLINHLPIGATIHVMNEEVDAGYIIAQLEVNACASDTSLSLYEKVQLAEISLLEQYLAKIVRGDFKLTHPMSEGNYNSIDDFKSLCHLDLKQVGTLQSHINLLRALSHGAFKNAYFIDENGQKIFINVQLTPELPTH